MIRCGLIVLALALPGPAFAKRVTVQSGEHEDFSRLVVYFEVLPDYAFGRVEGGYELQPNRADTTYDLTKVFTFIRRDRIASIETRTNGALFLEVNCDCHAIVFPHRGQLVIDIKDGAGLETGGHEAELPAAAGTDAADVGTDENDPTDAGAAEQTAGLAADHGTFRPQGSALVWNDIALSAPLSVPAPITGTATAPSSPVSDLRLAATQQAVVAQIARAAAEGLVVPNANPPASRVNDAVAIAPAQETASNASPASAEPTQPAEPDALNIRIATAFERGELPADGDETRNENGDPCLSPSHFDLANWGEPPDKGAAIAQYRAGLLGEFDAADPDSLAALARHYIYLTFGAEAKGLIRSFDGQMADATLLVMLAEIMDEGESNAFPAIAQQISCDSAAALWAIMAKPNLSRGDTVSVHSVLAAFSELPLHLRRHIGPGLAERFLQVNDANTAATIRNSITRAPGSHGADVAMMEAEIAMELGDRARGEKQLSEVLEDNGPLAPQAVVALVDARLEAGDLPTSELIETASALAFEARGSEIGAELTIAGLRALAHQGEIVRAMTELNLSRTPYDLPQESVDLVRLEAIDLASRTESDAEFLRVAFLGPLNLSNQPSAPEIRRRVANRLVTLGFHEAAREVLGEAPGVPSPEDRLIYAASFVGDERPGLAIGYLAGLKGEDAMRLRAEAHALAQEFDRAGALYSDLGALDEQARAAWQGQNLNTIRTIGSAAERAAAELIVTEVEAEGSTEIPDDPISLAQSERVLRESRDARRVLTALLDDIGQP